VFVKVVSVDEASGKVSLSMKLASQGDVRDLDPSHAEAQAEGERDRRTDPDTIREVEGMVTGSGVTGESSTFLPSRLLAQEVATSVPS
jgi:ribosomal protein S1